MSERRSRFSGPFATLPSECVSRDGRDREVVLVCPTRRIPQGALPLLDSAVPEPQLGDAVVVVEREAVDRAVRHRLPELPGRVTRRQLGLLRSSTWHGQPSEQARYQVQHTLSL